jgi:hypothetical protein
MLVVATGSINTTEQTFYFDVYKEHIVVITYTHIYTHTYYHIINGQFVQFSKMNSILYIVSFTTKFSDIQYC